jgi:vanillate O-demethylase ferredoxin subunit
LVQLAKSGRTFPVLPGSTILNTLLDAGVDVGFSCMEGICGSCETKVVSGVPDHRDAVLSKSERDANDKMMICCSGSKTSTLVLDL